MTIMQLTEKGFDYFEDKHIMINTNFIEFDK